MIQISDQNPVKGGHKNLSFKNSAISSKMHQLFKFGTCSQNSCILLFWYIEPLQIFISSFVGIVNTAHLKFYLPV